MQKALKIFFIILAIAVVGVGIYFVFFDTDRKLSVYNNANSVIDYKQNLGLDGDLLALDVYGYNNNTMEFSDSAYPDIFAIRTKLFASVDKIQVGTQESGYLNYYGYTMYENVLTEGIRYYANYASIASNAPKRSANVVNSVISQYRASIITLYNQACNVKQLQSLLEVKDSGVTSDKVYMEYENLRDSYRAYLKSSATLLTQLRDYIVVESFDNNYSFDTLAVLYDSVAETVLVAMSAKIEQEANYLNDASIYVDKYIEYSQTGSIDYGIVDEINYLLAYKNLYFKDRTDYDKIFKFTHYQKYDLIHGNNNMSSSIDVSFIDSATIVVGLLEL